MRNSSIKMQTIKSNRKEMLEWNLSILHKMDSFFSVGVVIVTSVCRQLWSYKISIKNDLHFLCVCVYAEMHAAHLFQVPIGTFKPRKITADQIALTFNERNNERKNERKSSKNP